MSGVVADLRQASRSLRRAPGFVVATVATLALGIGANTAVFSLASAFLLRPLPFGPKSERLVTLHSTHPARAQDWDDSELSHADLLDLRESSHTLEALEGLVHRNFSVAGVEESERVLGASVTPGLLPLVGAEPLLGRLFRPEEAARPGFEPVAILSHALWQRRFGGDPDLVGRTIRLNGRELTVIGVMPAGFRFPERHDLWVPYADERGERRDARSLLAVAALRPGVGLAEAQAELDTLAAGLAERFPDTNRDWGVRALPLRRFLVVPAARLGMTLLLGAVALVLVVGCANLAGLMLARGVARQRELAVRAALGAGGGRLVRLLLAESLLLAVAGGVLGMLLGAWGTEALVAALPEAPPWWLRIEVDGRALAYAAALAVASSLLLGLVPALRAAHPDLGEALGGSGRATAGRGQQRLLGGLVVGQLALCLALVVAASLLVRTGRGLLAADGGFDPGPLLTGRVYLAGDAYDPPAARTRFFSRMVERLQEQPGVAAAAATTSIPTDDGGVQVRLVGEAGIVAPGRELGAQLIGVTPGLFDALGVGLLEGRRFAAEEAQAERSGVAIVNRRLAARLWPGESALGRRLGLVEREDVEWLRVVGVAPDLVYEEPNETTAQSQLSVYVPYARLGWRSLAFLVRSEGDPAAVVAGTRRALAALDPGLGVYDVMTMRERRAFTSWEERFVGSTFGGFALAAVLLACLGAWGVTAYAAGQRSHELGVRLALGATRRDVARLLLGDGARRVLAGLALGAPLAALAARLVQGLLYAVSPFEPAIWLGVAAALAASVLLATWLPARRAARLDPIAALRQE